MRDEFPGISRLIITFTGPNEREFDWPFALVGREIDKVFIDGVEYVKRSDEPVTEPVKRFVEKYEQRIDRLAVANGKLCDEVNELNKYADELKQLISELWASCPVSESDCVGCRYNSGTRAENCTLFYRMKSLGIGVDE